MARSTIILKIPVGDIKTSTDNSYKGSINSTYLYGYKSVSYSSSVTDYDQGGWTLTLPKKKMPKTFILTTFQIPLQHKVTATSTDGISFAVQTNGVQYGIDINGNVTDSNFFTYVNSYIGENGTLPEIIFVAGAWVLKPSSGTSYASFQITHPLLTGTVEKGASTTFRPETDIFRGHSLQDGFSTIVSLINESVADDDASKIESYSGSTNNYVTAEYTSIVSFIFSIPSGLELIELRPVMRARLKNSTSSITCKIAIGDRTDTISASNFSYSSSYQFTPNAEYNTFENVFGSDSSIVKAINSYYAKSSTNISMELILITKAAGTSPSGYKSGTDSTASLSQIYFEAVYGEPHESGIHKKEDGTWKNIKSIYIKNNGLWILAPIKDDYLNHLSSHLVADPCKGKEHIIENLSDVSGTCFTGGTTGGTYCSRCKKLLSKHNIATQPRGHIETDYASSRATCTSTGLIGGKKCTKCGLITKNPETVEPALGHNYQPYSGKCSRCSSQDPNSITFIIDRNGSTSTKYAMPNTTWSQWIGTQSYWKINDSGQIQYSSTYIVNNVSANDIIIANQTYSTTDLSS